MLLFLCFGDVVGSIFYWGTWGTLADSSCIWGIIDSLRNHKRRWQSFIIHIIRLIVLYSCYNSSIVICYFVTVLLFILLAHPYHHHRRRHHYQSLPSLTIFPWFNSCTCYTILHTFSGLNIDATRSVSCK